LKSGRPSAILVVMAYRPKSKRTTPPEALSPEKFAGALDVCTETVHRWHRDGKIKGFYLSNKTLRFPRSELERLLTEARV
jgi:hypothetical protein